MKKEDIPLSNQFQVKIVDAFANIYVVDCILHAFELLRRERFKKLKFQNNLNLKLIPVMYRFMSFSYVFQFKTSFNCNLKILR